MIRYKKLADQVELAIIAESARWGDQSSATPYTVTDWRKQRDYILNTYMPQRPALVLSQLKNAGLYPTVDTPVFLVNGVAQQGGGVPANGLLTMAAPRGGDGLLHDRRQRPATARILVGGQQDRHARAGKCAEARPGPERRQRRGSAGQHLRRASTVTFYKAKGHGGQPDGGRGGHCQRRLAGRAPPRSRPASSTTSIPAAPAISTPTARSPARRSTWTWRTYVVLVTGKVMIPQAGNWTFGVSSDDGFGMTLSKGAKTYTMSYPSPRSPGDTLAVFNIAEAGVHDLRLVFYEQGGGSELELFAARGSFTTFSAASFRLVGDLAQGGLQVGEGNIWFANSFNDSSWRLGTGGVGYERGSGYETLFKIDVGAGDVQD